VDVGSLSVTVMETMDGLLEGRVRDLVSTADRQLAAQSYDAAIDTYRTALAELSSDAAAAVRAGIEERLASAGRARETSQRVTGLLAQARYQQTAGRLSESFAAVSQVLACDPGNAAAQQLQTQLLDAMPELAARAGAATPAAHAVTMASPASAVTPAADAVRTMPPASPAPPAADAVTMASPAGTVTPAAYAVGTRAPAGTVTPAPYAVGTGAPASAVTSAPYAIGTGAPASAVTPAPYAVGTGAPASAAPPAADAITMVSPAGTVTSAPYAVGAELPGSAAPPAADAVRTMSPANLVSPMADALTMVSSASAVTPVAAPAELPASLDAAEPAAVRQPEPETARPETDQSSPIQPPSFWQAEDDDSFTRRPRVTDYGTEPELLSILDPVARPEEPENWKKVLQGILTILGVVVALLGTSLFKHHASRFTPPAAVPDTQYVASPDDAVYRVGGGVSRPFLLSRIEPEYSEEARQAGLQGTVLLYAQIDPSGNAVNLRVLHGLGMGLDARAIEAVSRWRFQPGMKDGRPVTVEATVEVNFRLP
jgi:TonB family protein